MGLMGCGTLTLRACAQVKITCACASLPDPPSMCEGLAPRLLGVQLRLVHEI